MSPPASWPVERALVAQACRVLVARGLTDGLLGHVSLRVDDERLLVRCRGPEEEGLAGTRPDDVRLVGLDGSEGGPGELDGGYGPPHELPLHSEILRARPDVNAVVHAHPTAVVALDLVGERVRPVVGALDIPGALLAAGGVPVYERSVLVRDGGLGREVATAMGDRPVVVLRGHGLASAAASIAQAVLQAVSVDLLARLSLDVLRAGGRLREVPAEDLAGLPQLGRGLNVEAAWRHEVARTQRVLGP
ncbi:MAG TPA: class II aldolase/adducin family protein [Lapillicoccus sp.]|nr:class II aldolase/adducin family protein [Lapillicoccus sp.]